MRMYSRLEKLYDSVKRRQLNELRVHYDTKENKKEIFVKFFICHVQLMLFVIARPDLIFF